MITASVILVVLAVFGTNGFIYLIGFAHGRAYEKDRQQKLIEWGTTG